MNKRQKKKQNRFIQLCLEYGFHHIPQYREFREFDRKYHEFCIDNYRAEREMERILSRRFVAPS